MNNREGKAIFLKVWPLFCQSCACGCSLTHVHIGSTNSLINSLLLKSEKKMYMELGWMWRRWELDTRRVRRKDGWTEIDQSLLYV